MSQFWSQVISVLCVIVSRHRSTTCVTTEIKAVAAPMYVEPCTGRPAIKRLSQANKLVLHQRVEWVEDQYTDGGWALCSSLVAALRDARLPIARVSPHSVMVPPIPLCRTRSWRAPSC